MAVETSAVKRSVVRIVRYKERVKGRAEWTSRFTRGSDGKDQKQSRRMPFYMAVEQGRRL